MKVIHSRKIKHSKRQSREKVSARELSYENEREEQK